MFTKHRGELFLVLGSLFFSFNGVVVTLVLDHMSTFRLAQVRAIGAFALLFLITFIQDRKSLRAEKREIPTLMFYGVAGYAMVQLGYFIGIARNIPLGLVLILEFTAPIWIVLWIKFVRKKSVERNMWTGIAASLIGLALLAKVWQGMTLDLIGLLGSIGSAIALAIYFLVGEKQGVKRSAQAMTVWGLGFASLFWLILFPIWNFPFEFFTKQIQLEGALDAYSLPGWFLIAWVVILGTMVPYLFVVGGLRRLDASKSSVIGMLEPVLAGIFAWILLGQGWSLIQLIGALIVLIGIYIADKTKSAALVK
jgi:drug/metabolite transporter (DMT)-like permease